MSAAAAGWGLACLLLIYACSFVDRQILGLLVGPIRDQLQISDTQFSLLQGGAFVLFYAALGLPIGRWVDRGDRPWILAVGAALWSLFTALAGLSHTYGQLVTCRMLVGVGEATVVPVAYSLIADYFSSERRGLAQGVFGSGIYFGTGLAMLGGAVVVGAIGGADPVQLRWVGLLQPWQLTLIIVGLPGLLFAALAPTLREPRRSRISPTRGVAPSAPPSFPLAALLRASWTGIAPHNLAAGLLAMAQYSVLVWAPEALHRDFRIPVSQSATAVGLAVLLGGASGVLVGGWASDLLVRRGVQGARMVSLALVSAAAIPGAMLFAGAPTFGLSVTGVAGAIFFMAMLNSVGPAGVQELYPPRARGAGAAIFQLVANLLGLGLGPTVVAMASDARHGGPETLRAALQVTLPLTLLAATVLALSGRSAYLRVVRQAQAWTTPSAGALPSIAPGRRGR